jgi:hypothetical protein
MVEYSGHSDFIHKFSIEYLSETPEQPAQDTWQVAGDCNKEHHYSHKSAHVLC